MSEPTIDDAPVHYGNEEASAWLAGREAGRDVVEDLEYRLARRDEDVERVREHLVPLLVDVYPYSEDIHSDTAHDLRAGYIAQVAASRIKHQERLVKRITATNDDLRETIRGQATDLAVRDKRILDLEHRISVLLSTSELRSHLMRTAAEREQGLIAELREFRKAELRTPDDWADEMKIIVRDPDGWRPSARLGEKDWDVPINREEFVARMNASTVQPLPGSNWGRE